jgi:hypothetical protein
MSFRQNSARFQVLSVNAWTGNTYWQQPQDTVEDAEKHASRYTKNLADKFIYDVSYEGSITLIKTILHEEA